MPFGLQPIHLVVVAIVALLIFGPSKLPEIGRGVGRAITEFRRGAKEMSGTFMDEINQPDEPPDQSIGPAVVSSEAAQPQPYHQSVSPGVGPVSGSVEQPAQNNFCIHCGKANPTGAIFCNQCGGKITE